MSFLKLQTTSVKVIQSVKSVYSGISVFGQSVFYGMKNRMQSRASQYQSEAAGLLTLRGLDIVKLVAQGYDNRAIAAELYLAEGTVHNNLSQLLEKLKLKDRIQLAVFAVKNNLD